MKPEKSHNILKNLNKIVLFSALTVTALPSTAEMSSNVQEMYISKGEHTEILNTVARMHENIYLRLRNLQELKQNRIKAEILAEQDLDLAYPGS